MLKRGGENPIFTTDNKETRSSGRGVTESIVGLTRKKRGGRTQTTLKGLMFPEPKGVSLALEPLFTKKRAPSGGGGSSNSQGGSHVLFKGFSTSVEKGKQRFTLQKVCTHYEGGGNEEKKSQDDWGEERDRRSWWVTGYSLN